MTTADLEARAKWTPEDLFAGKKWIPFSGLVYTGCKAIFDSFKDHVPSSPAPVIENCKHVSRTALRCTEFATLFVYNELVFSAAYVFGYELSQKLF